MCDFVLILFVILFFVKARGINMLNNIRLETVENKGIRRFINIILLILFVFSIFYLIYLYSKRKIYVSSKTEIKLTTYTIMNLQVIKIKRIRLERIKSERRIIRLIALLLLCNVLLLPNFVQAQEEGSISENFNFNLDLQNMHLWHGFVVTPGIMMASSIEYSSKNDKFIAGLWGGANYDGTYKEFSYYTKYNFTYSFNISLISHNNYSDYEDPNIFSYDKYTSPNFVDVVLEYTISNELPLTFYWSTILLGNGGDYETNNDGSVTNSYSNYAELRYSFFPQKKTKLTLFAGGAFSFVTEKTFYSESANLVNLGLNLKHDVNFFERKFPVSATAFWNPESKVGALQLAISII